MCQVVINLITKKYKKRTIFENVSLTLESRKYNFFIGENGTGKSTMIKCILDEIKYSGSIEKKDLTFSYAPESIVLPDYITLNNFLILLAKSKSEKNKKINEIIDYYLKLFSVENYKDYYIFQLSKGTRQKIILIQALVCDADVYIFDEPMSGLDEESRRNFIKELQKLKRRNKLIIVSTHYLEEYNFRSKNVLNFPIVTGVEYESLKTA